MKFLFSLIIFLFCFSNLQAQLLKKETMLAIRKDNVTALKAISYPGQENACLDQKGLKFSLLGLSIKFKSQQCFEYLISKEKIDVDLACDYMSPLMYAAKYNQLEMAKKLIEAGADKTKENNGKTALDIAKKYKRTAIIEYLSK